MTDVSPRSPSSDLTGQVVVVPGGTGNVGEGVVRAFLTGGATVVVPSRRPERLDQLTELLAPELRDRLVGIAAPYGTFDETAELADQILRDHGAIDHVVASVGGWFAGKALWQITTEDWETAYATPLLTHTALAHAFVPRLAERGSYTIMGGITAYAPQPGASLASMQGAALLMMRSALSTELNGQRRVNALVLAPVLNRSRPHGDRSWLNADQVGEASVAIALDSSVADEDVMVRTQDELAALLQRTHQDTR